MFHLSIYLSIMRIDSECVREDTIRAMETLPTVLGVFLEFNSAIVLTSSMNDLSVALIAFNQRDIFVEVKLM